MSKIKLAEKTAEEIKELIKRENYKAGMKLPSEKELCASLKVGRNTLREAERILQACNIVSIQQGSGTYVTDHDVVDDDPFKLELISDKSQLIKDILEIMELMEPQCAVLAALRHTDQNVEQMQRALDKMKRKVSRGKSPIEEECVFFQELAKASGNLIMERMSPIITDGIRMLNTVIVNQDFNISLRNYSVMLYAIRHGLSNEARLTMEYHLLNVGRQYQQMMHNQTSGQ